MWVALFDGARVLGISPDGDTHTHIELPTSNVTACGFGGPDLRTLYITPALHRLTAKELNDQPFAGSVFAVDLNVPGRPERPVASPLPDHDRSG